MGKLSSVRLFLLDMDGTFYLDSTPLPGALQLFNLAKDPGDCTVLGLGYIVENLALLAQQGRMPQLN